MACIALKNLSMFGTLNMKSLLVSCWLYPPLTNFEKVLSKKKYGIDLSPS